MSQCEYTGHRAALVPSASPQNPLTNPMASGDTSFPQEIFKRHVTAMRIGYDHATIATIVTLDNKEDTASDRGRLLRATARLYDSKAVYGSRTDSRPKPERTPEPARGRARYGASQSEVERCLLDIRRERPLFIMNTPLFTLCS